VRAITDAVRDDLPDALEAVLEECRPAGDAEVVAGIGAVVGLVGQNWARAGRDEFIALAAGELLSLPGALVLDALGRARRRVTEGRMLVAWICDDVEPKAARLHAERDRMTRLAELAAEG